MVLPAHWTFHIVTLGCKINQYESQAIREAWTALGGHEVALDAAPQVFLVNSCAITARGERDTRHAFYRAHNLANSQTHNQAHNLAHRQHEASPSLRILTGCAATLVAKTWAEQKKSPQPPQAYFDVLIPPKAKAVLMQDPAVWGLEHFLSGKDIRQLSIPDSVSPFGEGGFSITSFRRSRPVLKVQDGCSHGCTYCIVPLMRGKSVSRPAMDIVHEAQRLLQAGHSEIMLSGINLHHYGRDLQDSSHVKDFWDLLNLLEKHLAGAWQGKARLRISSLEPSQLNDKGLDSIMSSSLLCPHLHLSLQHGSASVLKRMGRGHYKLDALQQKIQRLRQVWPYMGLGADILMGFAGESEEDVQATLDCIAALGLSYAHVFPYSLRPGTAAEKFTDHVPHALRLERAARVRVQVEAQEQAFLHSLLQKDRLALVLDGSHACPNAHSGDTEKKLFKGVEAHYAACEISLQPQQAQGIVWAKPVAVQGSTLHCEAVEV